MDYMTQGRQPGVIMKQIYQEAGTETDPRAACAVFDEATGELIVGADSDGGGGESDFTTATVTVQTDLGTDIEYYGAFYRKTEPLRTVGHIRSTGPATLYVVLYKGEATITGYNVTLDDDLTVEVVSGDAEVFQTGYLIVRGDCTVSVTGEIG